MVSFSVSMLLRKQALSEIAFGLQLAAMGGIAAGMIFNYLGNRYIVFRKTHVRR